MADLDLYKTQISLNQISENLDGLGNALRHMDSMLQMIDTLAAHIIGIRAVVGTVAKKYPVDMKDVDAWLKENVTADGVSYDDIRSVALHMVTGEAPPAPKD